MKPPPGLEDSDEMASENGVLHELPSACSASLEKAALGSNPSASAGPDMSPNTDQIPATTTNGALNGPSVLESSIMDAMSVAQNLISAVAGGMDSMATPNNPADNPSQLPVGASPITSMDIVSTSSDTEEDEMDQYSNNNIDMFML